jgi:hypothetical protein
VQPRLDEAMGRRIGGSPKAQARFLDRIEGVRSPAVIEVTASPGKRCRFFGFYRDREGRTEQQAAPSVRERGVPTKGRVFTRALMKLGYFSPLALKQAHLSASVNVGSGEPRFLMCSPEYMRETRSKFVVDLVAFDFSRGQSGNFRVADRGVQRKGSRNVEQVDISLWRIIWVPPALRGLRDTE